MRVLLDACVIYPTVMREMLLGVAASGVFTPLWSARIMAEWQHAAAGLGPQAVAQAAAEAALLARDWPGALVAVPPALEARLWLPDRDDVHVLAAAVAGDADIVVTLNIRDFPRAVLAGEGLARAHPDPFLLGLWKAGPAPVEETARAVLAEARRLSREDWTLRALLKKAHLPRLGKALQDLG